jgi:hypothetical protein
MLFHRAKEPVTVLSRAEEDALGPEWSRIIWPVSAIAEPKPAPAPEPEPPSEGYSEAEPEEEPAPAAPIRPARAHNKPSPARGKKKG